MRRDEERSHQRVWELLPWYANGTLEPGERRTVEEHAARCERCRQELEECRQLGAALSPLQDAGETAPTPHPARLARLMARVDQIEETGRASFPRRLRSLFAATPAPARRLLAAQLALIVLLAGAWAWKAVPAAPDAPAEYRTLSDPAPPAPAASLRVRVVFAEDATEQQIREVLLGVGGQLAGGPSPLGAYTVEIPSGRDPVPIILSFLRSRPEVRFAEPLGGGG